MQSDSESWRIQLIGGLQLGNPDGTADLLTNLFGRLTREVEHTGNPARFVGYESGESGRGHVRFFGIEVDHIDQDVPDGMVAWDLGDDAFTLLEKSHIIHRDNLVWQWRERSALGRMHGEFSAGCPSEWGGQPDSTRREFWIFANGYAGIPESYDDDVQLVDYDPFWPGQFEETAKWLREELGPDLALRVEHYGSTAIPNMPAKPVIDVLVEIPSFAEARRRVIPRLDGPEWEYWWYSGHMIFIKRNGLMATRTHHIHMAPAGHQIWNGLVFRDYLRSYPEEASHYAALKHELAAAHRSDRERYTIEKGAYVQEVTARAMCERRI